MTDREIAILRRAASPSRVVMRLFGAAMIVVGLVLGAVGIRASLTHLELAKAIDQVIAERPESIGALKPVQSAVGISMNSARALQSAGLGAFMAGIGFAVVVLSFTQRATEVLAKHALASLES